MGRRKRCALDMTFSKRTKMGPSKSGENALGCNPCLSLLGILAWITVNFLTGNTFLSVSLRL